MQTPEEWQHPKLIGDFYPIIFRPHFESIVDGVDDKTKEKMQNAHIGFDLGSGTSGYSAHHLLSLCPKLQELHTVDSNFDRNDVVVPETVSHHHHHQFIGAFLSEPPVQADVALFCSVPEHQITTDSRKADLYNALSSNGVVICLGPDTFMNLTEQQGFSLVYENTTSRIKVWVKTPHVPETDS